MMLLLSLLICAFGTPANWFLCVLASLFGYGLFWFSIWRYAPKQRFWAGLVWYAIVHGIQLSWMATPFYHGTYIYFVYLGLLSIFSFQFALFCSLMHRVKSVMALAAIWTLCEWMRQYILCGYIWHPMGLTLTHSIWPMQFASVAGIWGLTFWVALTNFSFARMIQTGKMALFLFCGASPFIYGGMQVWLHQGQIAQAKRLDVALVQTGLDVEEKMKIHPLDQWKMVIDPLMALKKVDLVVFPESSFPYPARAKLFPSSHEDIAAQLSKELNADVVMGLEDVHEKRCYNSALLIRKEGRAQSYYKRVLMPLAEQLPFEFMRPLVATYGIFDFFTAGSEPEVFASKAKLIPSVCYDECFGQIVREGRLKGGELLVNLTNDIWFHHSNLPQEHYFHTRLRSVENGVPHVRACNNGVTVALDSLGREIAKLPVENADGSWHRGVLEVSVPLFSYRTIYLFFGDALIISLCFLLMFYTMIKKKLLKKSGSATVLTIF
ncbi:MAG: apolipoprotein N-acyltransferase [Simkaniaceae bacterium]|nr:apolipoprotein N-acyltransferase [Simkaniaceae bacterium]